MRDHIKSITTLITLIALSLSLNCCQKDEQRDTSSMMSDEPAAGVDMTPDSPPDMPLCPPEIEAQCDDGIECTIDACTAPGECAHTPDDSYCVSDQLCVSSYCDPAVGCMSSPMENCCGNGVVEADEECDDSNVTDGDGCSATCSREPICPGLCVSENTHHDALSRITPRTQVGFDRFGTSVAVYDDLMVVGAPQYNDFNESKGVAHIYRRVNGEWMFEETLSANDGRDGDRYGLSVAVHQETVVIGAPSHFGDANRSGGVYIYQKQNNAWVMNQKLTLSIEYASFGSSISLDEDVLVVGASGDEDNKVYVYRRVNGEWTESQVIVPSADENASCGERVAVDGDVLAISCPRDNANNTEFSGSVHLYTLQDGTFVPQQTLSSLRYHYFMGSGLALSGDHLAVRINAENGQVRGSVVMYRRTPSNSWREVSKLYNIRFRAYGVYCSSLVFGDDTLAIGSKTHDANDVSDSGSVDLYQWSNGSWVYQRSTSRLDASSGDQFGTAVALGGAQLMVGTGERNAQGGETGSVYVYDLDNPEIMCINEYECACSTSSEDPTCAEE